MSTNPARHKRRRVALVLQGGGALGAYQAGVFQALAERDLAPDWVVGTSIGAVNAAIIAGNEPAQRIPRMREFWELVEHRDWLDMAQVPDGMRRSNSWLATLDVVLRGVPGFFSPRPFNPFAADLPVAPEAASFYDTQELKATLLRLVNFTRLGQPEATRLSVTALCVTSGDLASFDSARQAVGVDHVMASCALPPGFPPVRIDGNLYWDGGLYSNTPLAIALDDEPRVDTLCFMVDLWRAQGPEPRTFDEVQTRQKDVTYASRSQRHIDDHRRLHDLRNALYAMYVSLPPALQEAEKLRELADSGCDTTMHIVRLQYAGHDWLMPNKDINFSSGSIEWRWRQGYRDAMRAIDQAAWLAPQPPHIGVVVHELPPDPGDR